MGPMSVREDVKSLTRSIRPPLLPKKSTRSIVGSYSSSEQVRLVENQVGELEALH